MKCSVCKGNKFSMQDRCIPCFKKNAVLAHDMKCMEFDSRKDAELRDSIEGHAEEYPSQRELFQRAVTELESGLPGAALTTVRDARALARNKS